MGLGHGYLARLWLFTVQKHILTLKSYQEYPSDYFPKTESQILNSLKEAEQAKFFRNIIQASSVKEAAQCIMQQGSNWLEFPKFFAAGSNWLEFAKFFAANEIASHINVSFFRKSCCEETLKTKSLQQNYSVILFSFQISVFVWQNLKALFDSPSYRKEKIIILRKWTCKCNQVQIPNL